MHPAWQRPEVLFTPDPARAALVVIDMQNFSCAPRDGDPMPGLEQVINQINALAKACRECGVPVIWVRHELTLKDGQDNGGLYSRFHSPQSVQAVMAGSQGGEIYAAMQVDATRDHVARKNRYSAFLSDPPELREKLTAMGRNQLLIAGVASNVCVESTLRDAMQLDYEVILVADGVDAPDPAALTNTLNNTRLFFGDMRSASEIAAELARGQA